jgi:hypothetical protein
LRRWARWPPAWRTRFATRLRPSRGGSLPSKAPAQRFRGAGGQSVYHRGSRPPGRHDQGFPPVRPTDRTAIRNDQSHDASGLTSVA